jgi:hypothetical protein
MRRLRLWAALVNGTAAVATVALFAVLLPLMPVPDGAGAAGGRLVLAVQLAAAPAALLWLMVAAVSLSRVAGNAFNPIDDPEPRLYRVNQRVLGNTVEQTIVFVPALLAASTLAPADQAAGLVLATAFFVAARLLFWAGYLAHPFARAPGMTATATVNFGLLVYVISKLFI